MQHCMFVHDTSEFQFVFTKRNIINSTRMIATINIMPLEIRMIGVIYLILHVFPYELPQCLQQTWHKPVESKVSVIFR